MVGGVNHDGVFREARCVEIIENAADVFINGFHTAQVIVKVLLIGRFALLFVRQARQVDRTGGPIGLLHIGDHRPPRCQPTGDRRAHLASRLRAMGKILPQTVRLRNLDVRQVLLVTCWGFPLSVRRLVVQHHEERFLFILSLLQPIECVIRHKIGVIAVGARTLSRQFLAVLNVIG